MPPLLPVTSPTHAHLRCAPSSQAISSTGDVSMLELEDTSKDSVRRRARPRAGPRRWMPVAVLALIALAVLLLPTFLGDLHRERVSHDPAKDRKLVTSLFEHAAARKDPETFLLRHLHAAGAPEPSCRAQYELNQSGFAEPPPDSSVLMLFAAQDPPRYRYVEPTDAAAAGAGARGMGGVGGVGGDGACTPLHDAAYLSRSFGRVASSFLSSPHAAATVGGGAGVPYFDFFGAHEATLWETSERATEDGGVRRRAVPLQVDVVYTYVNPAAASFRRHLAQRNITYTSERRYNDWEELRYSLRSVLGRALRSEAVRQYPARVREDAVVLSALGYEVDLRVRRTPWDRAGGGEADAAADAVGEGDAPFSLFRTVYLLLSDEDQVPAWLNVSLFPQLRVVTHRDLFNDRDDPGVLPTLNSNAIESGLHRIPGLSRHFLYVNNDHLLGRQLSLFDLFRPLSPTRQQLRVVHNALTSTAHRGAPPCAEALPARRFSFLEPLLHSHTTNERWDEPYQQDADFETKRAGRAAEMECLRSTALHSLRAVFTRAARARRRRPATGAVAPLMAEDLRGFLSHPPWDTTRSLSLPDPHEGPTPFGLGVGPRYYNYLMTRNVHGFRPPYSYAHIAHMYDREVSVRLTESVYASETRKTRLAYEREMYPFSIVDVYGAVAAALTRARVREEWRAVMACGGGGTALHPAAAAWAAGAAARVSGALSRGRLYLPVVSTAVSSSGAYEALGPLYGDTWDVRLQSPELPDELGLWWLPGARPAQVERRSYRHLANLYRVPQLRVFKAAGSGAGANQRWGEERLAVYERLPENYYGLYHDVFAHERRDRTYRFDMLVSPLKALLVAARMREERAARSLFVCYNDDFDAELLRTTGMLEQTKAAFKILMLATIDDEPAAPWESDA